MGTVSVTNLDTIKTKDFSVEGKVCGTDKCTGTKPNGDCCQDDGKCKCPPEHSTEKRVFSDAKPDPASTICPQSRHHQ